MPQSVRGLVAQGLRVVEGGQRIERLFVGAIEQSRHRMAVGGRRDGRRKASLGAAQGFRPASWRTSESCRRGKEG